MVKLTVLYGQPTSAAAFEKYYAETHLPIAAKIQGVRRIELSKVISAADGSAPAFYRLADLYFDDADHMQARDVDARRQSDGRRPRQFRHRRRHHFGVEHRLIAGRRRTSMAEAPGQHNPNVLPAGIPAPQDDGGARHLIGLRLPDMALAATDGTAVNLSTLKGRTVLYIYPRTGVPGVALPEGWDEIPGARGCTPQSCGFRDHHAELTRLGVAHLYGLSTQDTAYQQEAATRLHLPFALLSDEQLKFTKALDLPTFVTSGMTLAEAHGADRRRRRHHPRVLSGVPAGQERGGGGCVAEGVGRILIAAASPP